MSPTTPAADLTTILRSWREGNDQAFGALVERVYGTLKVIAAERLRQMGGTATLSATELLHEALIDIMPTDMSFSSRAHFFATMSLAIRSVLVDHARARAANKRGGDLLRVTFTHNEQGEESPAFELIAIDAALSKLETLDPRAGQIMHLTYFSNLEQAEIAAVLGVSVASVTRDLKFARAWVMDAIGFVPSSPAAASARLDQ